MFFCKIFVIFSFLLNLLIFNKKINLKIKKIFYKIVYKNNIMKNKIQLNFKGILIKCLLVLIFGVLGELSWGQVTYTLQTGNFTTNSLTTNTNGNYFAGTVNNSVSEVKFYANGSGSGYTGDPGVASFQTFTTNGIGSGTARPLKVGDEFTITCYVANSSSFFNSSNSGISFNGNTTYSSFANYSTNQRAKFQINKDGNWFSFANGAGSGYATPGQDVTFTIKLTSGNTANMTISSANGATTYDMLLANSPSENGDNITSFAIWNRTSGSFNDMYWKNGSLTATGSVELGNGNGTSTISGVISNGLAANSTSTVSSNVLTKTGSGTITLTAQNTYTGLTTVAAGTLKLNRIGGNTLPVTNNVTLNGGTLQISSDQTLNNLTLSSGGLTIDDGVTLTINGTLNYTGGSMNYGSTSTGNLVISRSGNLIVSSGTFSTMGRLTLKSDASGTASIGNSAGTISGNVTVERYIPGLSTKRYRFLSSPVSTNVADWRGEIFITGGGTSSQFSSVGTNNIKSNGLDWTLSGAPSMFGYTENLNSGSLNSRWEAITSGSTTLTVGKGYRVFIRGDRSSSGVLDNSVTSQSAVTITSVGTINSGSQTLPVTYNGSSTDDGWNLVGNPYPSSIDWNASSGWTKTNVSGTIWIYNPSTNTYGNWDGNTITNGVSRYISSGQAFFTRTSAGSPALSCTEAVKTSNVGSAIFKTSNLEENTLRISLVKNETNKDEAVIRFMDGKKDDFSENDDVRKFYNPTVNISSFFDTVTYASVNYLSKELINDKIVPISAWVDTEGDYSLSFTGIENFNLTNRIILKDNFLNTYTNLNTNPNISFKITSDPKSKGDNRFEIIFESKSITNIQNINFKTTNLTVFPNPATDILNINLSNANFKNSNIVIYNVSGMEVSKSTMNGASAQLNIETLGSGVYFVKVSNENGFSKTVKFVK